MNKKKVIIGFVGLVVIFIAIITVVAFVQYNTHHNRQGSIPTQTQTTMTEETTIEQQKETDSRDDEDYPTVSVPQTETQVSETNYFDNIEVVEETTKKNKKSKKNKKNKKTKATEAYPGENDGWSPIVSPDDLEQ